MNLIEEGVREARKVRARQGDRPEVTVDPESPSHRCVIYRT